MKKQKICFDTSAVCSLFDNSHNTPVVARMFDYLDHNSESFGLYASPIFYNEVAVGSEQLVEKIDKIIKTYNIAPIPDSLSAISLTEIYLQKQVLTENHLGDLAHIAYASVSSCDYFITCDKKHIVRQKTIDLVQKINTEQNIFVPKIVTPSNFMEIQK
ncbi:MAG: hypothetical protein LBU34_05005 [Planctomycetaceae bacterium]|jgi:predicted nucleic acid-binding protein|nr:hypothetical protein [Planctomycetaceae bacterium]